MFQVDIGNIFKSGPNKIILSLMILMCALFALRSNLSIKYSLEDYVRIGVISVLIFSVNLFSLVIVHSIMGGIAIYKARTKVTIETYKLRRDKILKLLSLFEREYSKSAEIDFSKMIPDFLPKVFSLCLPFTSLAFLIALFLMLWWMWLIFALAFIFTYSTYTTYYFIRAISDFVTKENM